MKRTAYFCLLENVSANFAQSAEIFANTDSGRLHGVDFGLRGSTASADDGTGMAHPSAGGSRQSGNKSNHRFRQIPGDEF